MIFAPFAFRNQVIVATPAAATALQYDVVGYAQGTITVNRNGSAIATLTADTSLTSITINAGDTVQMTLTGGSEFLTFIYYYLNGVLQATYSGTTTISSAIITTTAGNNYYFAYEGAA
jgi:hypothetical protein